MSATVSAVVDQVRSLDDATLTQRFRELELAARRLEAQRIAVAAEVEARRVHHADGHRSLGGWVRGHTNCAGTSAARLRRRVRLTRRHPHLLDALNDGRFSVDHLDDLARLAANPRLTDALADTIDDLVEHAERLGADDFHRVTRQWEHLADTDGAARSRHDAITGRRAFAGMVGDELHVEMHGGSPTDTAAFLATVDAFAEHEYRADLEELHARHGTGASHHLLPRTPAQRRYDALQRMARAAAAAGPAAGGTPVPVVVNVVVDRHSFELALAGAGITTPPIDLTPPELDQLRSHTTTGVVYAPADIVRAALSGHVRRVVLDSRRVVIDLGRKRRLFTGAARDAVKLLTTHCEFPGCTVPATHAEIDHLHPHAHGGPTSPANGAVTCRAHNQLKNHGYRAHRQPDGHLHWTRPDGTPLHPVSTRLLTPLLEEHRILDLARQRLADLCGRPI